ncbi:hypothetical protein C9426_34980 [Serratia sp. S1B]|nr:hypothetical protein C9426_34980 [Serratia sp. S1B]
MDEISAKKELEKATPATLFLFLLGSIIFLLFGAFMVFIFGGGIWHAIIDGYIHEFGNSRISNRSSIVTSGFSFWLHLVLYFIFLLMGLFMFLSGYVGFRALFNLLKARVRNFFGIK